LHFALRVKNYTYIFFFLLISLPTPTTRAAGCKEEVEGSLSVPQFHQTQKSSQMVTGDESTWNIVIYKVDLLVSSLLILYFFPLYCQLSPQNTVNLNTAEILCCRIDHFLLFCYCYFLRWLCYDYKIGWWFWPTSKIVKSRYIFGTRDRNREPGFIFPETLPSRQEA
jgi:hypothetical protein